MKDYEVKSVGDPGNVARNRAYRQRRKAQFQCQSCGGLTIAGQSRCPGCKARIKDAMTQRRENRISQGLCYSCGKAPASTPGKQCPGCTEKTRVQNAKDRQRRIQEATDAQQDLGEEVKSMQYLVKSDTDKTGPARKKRAFRERSAARSTCVDCGAATGGTTARCPSCRTKANLSNLRRRYKLSSQGICITCGKAPASSEKEKRCPGCIEKQRVQNKRDYERRKQELTDIQGSGEEV